MAKKRKRRIFKVGYRQRQALGGLLFTFPFIIGFSLFFLRPFIESILFSLNELQLGRDGYTLVWKGLGNFSYALFQHATFNERFVENITDTLSTLPMIIGFSLFAASILNQRFRGRSLARMILFLPVILGAGVVLRWRPATGRTSWPRKPPEPTTCRQRPAADIGHDPPADAVLEYLIEVITGSRNHPRLWECRS